MMQCYGYAGYEKVYTLVSQTMPLQAFHFGIPEHGWIKISILGDENTLEFEISDIPKDPINDIVTIIGQIGRNENPDDLMFNLEPAELKLNYGNGDLVVSIDGKFVHKFKVNVNEYGYHLAMAVNRLSDQCKDLDLTGHWPSKIPEVK